ncbi:MAG TPA: GAF domain-containing protein, partial [Armatimonadetes bacterium]|nr:GAF domain-containing protein [Armatimonadota bacterium]
LLDNAVDEIITVIANHYEAVTEREVAGIGEKFSVLLERAGDAVLLLEPDDGMIIRANLGAEEMFDCLRSELEGRTIFEFITPEQLDACRARFARARKEGSAVMHNLVFKRRDEVTIPTHVRVTQIGTGRRAQMLCIIRDVTEIYELHRQLEDAKQLLEEQVSERTRQLERSQQRYRELFEREQRRAAQLNVVTRVAQEALKALDLNALYCTTVEALREHFRFFDVALFEVDAEREELILRAHAGAYAHELPKDYRQKVGTGIIGWVAQTGEPLLVNDVMREPRYVQATPNEAHTRSELAVPIRISKRTVGVIDVQASVVNAFAQDDVQVLQTVADQVANAIEAITLFQRVRMFQELNERIIDSFPESVAVLNERGIIVAANPKFCNEVKLLREEIVGKHLADVVDQSLLEQLNLHDAIHKVMENGEPVRYLGVLHFSQKHPPRLLEIHLIRLQAGDRRRVLFLVDDATQRSRRAYELEMLLQITQAMEETLELNRLLHAILTCLTAGPGLGFNRAVLFLVNDDGTAMEVALAVGPATREEAYAVWARVAQEKWTLRHFLDDYPGDEGLWQSPFQQAVRGLTIPLDNKDDPLVQCLYSREIQKLSQPINCPTLHPRLRELFGETEVVCVPLIAKNKPLGLITADNAFSGQPITPEEIELLRLFATPAALAIDNARAYQQLEQRASELDKALRELREAQEQLIRSEKLAAIGEVAARVSHEIRNPLTTIGGFARAILKRSEDVERVKRNARIIYSEVRKLEQLLQEMLDFTSPKPPQFKMINLNDLITRICTTYERELRDANVELCLDLADGLPPAPLDPIQMERLLINLIRNAIQAMRQGGQLTIRTWCEDDWIKLAVSDTGAGIPPDVVPHLFTPFFTTKPDGS